MASSNKTIRFTIKTVTEGGEQVQALGVNVKDLSEMIESTQKKASKKIRLEAVAVGFDAMTNLIEKLNGVLQDLSDAYKVQEQAETKLAAAMRNTMGATDGEIQSIKELCSAQQELGVIGDEVQLQGAERLSTYLETTDALKQLIPVMNDLTVKQYGMDASGENSAAVAAMLGKAMQGNVTALKRLGIEFTDTQKTILEYGTEAEKAALLSDVIGQKVGGMNAELAKTDSGTMKQLKNTLGDIKEAVGQAASKITPFINILSQVGTAALGVQGVIKGLNVAIPIFSRVTTAASSAVKGLSVSIKALMVSTGVGVAIAALAWAIEKLMDTADKATDAMDDLIEAEKRAEREAESLKRAQQEEQAVLQQTKVAIDINIQRLKNFQGTQAEEKKLVSEMNGVYGETLGYFSSVSEWYHALIEDSDAYCKQMVLEARTRILANRIAEKKQEFHDIKYGSDGKAKMYSSERETKTDREYVSSREALRESGGEIDGIWIGSGWYDVTREIEGTSDLDKAEQALTDLNNEISDLNKQLTQAIEETANLDFKVKGSPEPPKEESKKPETNFKAAQREAEREAERIAEAERRAEEERLAAHEEAEERILELKSRNLGSFIANMEEGYNKELALLNKSYSDKIAEISRKEKELTELRIKEGKEGLEESEKALFEFARKMAEETRNKARDALKPIPVTEIGTYDELQKALSYWNRQFDRASEEERLQIYKTITALNELKNTFDRDSGLSDRLNELKRLKSLTGQSYKTEVKATGLDGWLDKMREMQKLLADPTVTENQKKNARELMEEYRKLAAESVNTFDKINEGWNAVKNLGSNIKSLTEALNGQKDAWEALTSVVDAMIGIYQTVMEVMGMVNTLTEIFTATKSAETAVTETATAAKVEGATEEVAASASVASANAIETTSEVAKASAKTFSAHSSIPWVGIAIAGGMVAAMLATMLSLPKFANGGIVSGPTLGLMGEYAGASSNPEVIAPLDKLKSMIGGGTAAVVVGGEVKVKGKDLVIALRNQTSISSKSGKRTGIKI